MALWFKKTWKKAKLNQQSNSWNRNALEAVDPQTGFIVNLLLIPVRWSLDNIFRNSKRKKLFMLFLQGKGERAQYQSQGPVQSSGEPGQSGANTKTGKFYVLHNTSEFDCWSIYCATAITCFILCWEKVWKSTKISGNSSLSRMLRSPFLTPSSMFILCTFSFPCW